MDAVPVWLALAGLGLIGALAALLWRGSDKRHDSHAQRLNEHETRLATLEEEMRTVKHETTLLREKWHDLVAQVSHSLASWYTDLVKLIKENDK